uniref:RNA-directed DNA polymerase, eukaryota n=1 Tax=Tanacetum cinerariifolium TaxID=118510 RepID=A0A699I925_TANCI|nr:RNA-directed DNA polymerase, eukaryota [Tanacetum cinerariifolium]
MRSKRDIVNELSEIDKELDNGLISETNILRRLELKSKLLNINDMESKDYIQKAKVTWAIEGDENSKFFHGIINIKRSQLAIRGIFVDGTWCTEPGTIKQMFVKHFEARFKEPGLHRFKFNFQFPKRLIQIQADDLERVVSRDEIRLAVWNCGDNKSPGPDGYSFEFLKKYWDIIGPDLCEAVEYFFRNGSFPKGCNSSFIALIPKVVDAKFKTTINVFKVDFAKAYDSISWDYLLDVLESFGFGQGDPLAPYLFILVMGSLHLSIRRLVDSGLYNGILLPGSETISHLFYADDVMFIRVSVGGRMTRLKAWDNVIAKLRTRLSKWKVKTLSIGGRLTLLKFVLGASPIYSMSIFKVPSGVLKTMEAIRSRALTRASGSITGFMIRLFTLNFPGCSPWNWTNIFRSLKNELRGDSVLSSRAPWWYGTLATNRTCHSVGYGHSQQLQ